MPEITVIHIALIVAATIIGVLLGWAIRSSHATKEKAAIGAGWQGQIDAQRTEHQRLVFQNKNLMDQVSQFQASNRDAKNRAKELSLAVQEAFERRDELQREIKDIRSNLEVAVIQRDKLKSDMAARDEIEIVENQKDDKIFQLSRELEKWRDRLPPLIERYRVRNEEAEQLEADLTTARMRIEQLENTEENIQTRIEPVQDPDALTDGREASNDPIEKHETTDDSGEGDPPVRNNTDHPFSSLRDDLKRIKGVGPAIEKTLNEMGIFRFQQIADMSEYDIDRVARRLKGFHSRIYREDWIGQARELNEQNRSA